MANVSRYIALEGVDGSGKSTVGKALLARLEAESIPARLVREPGGTPVGESIRDLLLHSDHLSPWAEVLLFAAQRAELVETVVGPTLANGEWVISDRSYYSSIAYQGHARRLGADLVRSINEAGLRGVIPDHVFVIDVDPSVALSRQSDADRIGREGVEFQSAVRDAYHAMSELEDHVVVLDGTLGIDEIVDEIMERARG